MTIDNVSESQVLQVACFEEDFAPFDCLVVVGEELPVDPRDSAPSATFSPTAAGLCHPEVPGLTQELRAYILEPLPRVWKRHSNAE